MEASQCIEFSWLRDVPQSDFEWKDEENICLLIETRAIICDNSFEASQWIIFSSGKNWINGQETHARDAPLKVTRV